MSKKSNVPNNVHSKTKIGIEELCSLYGFPKSTAYNWVGQRFIPHSKVGKRLVFDIDEINKWILSMKIKTKREIQNS